MLHLIKRPKRIQKIVDNAPSAEKYCTDGFLGYVDVIYPGKHIRNAATLHVIRKYDVSTAVLLKTSSLFFAKKDTRYFLI